VPVRIISSEPSFLRSVFSSVLELAYGFSSVLGDSYPSASLVVAGRVTVATIGVIGVEDDTGWANIFP
jgi:hypothetical protein